jgi:Holliday junction resolvase RusA-like endonuclease
MAESRSIVLRVSGHPKPQPRARARAVIQRDGKAFATVYPAGTDAGWRECVTVAAKQSRPVAPFTGPCRVDIVFIFPRPKNHFSTGAKGGLSRSAPRFWHTKGKGEYGGDRDNLEKTILDVLTQCGFWTDDGLVCCGQVVKRWACIGERPGALVVITPMEDREPAGWLFDLDRKMRKLDAAAPAPKTQQVIPPVAPAAKPNPVRQFTDLWVTKWMARHMTRYPFAGAKDAVCATRIWDACGHDLAFAVKVIDSFLADDQEFYKGHTLQMLSAAGVLPKFLAGARPAAVQRDLTIKELYANRGPGK